jgi:hypothetical protein
MTNTAAIRGAIQALGAGSLPSTTQKQALLSGNAMQNVFTQTRSRPA